MKHTLTLLLLACGLATCPISTAAQTFTRGADTSWSSEMEADGRHFYNVTGKQTDISVLMRECGMNAVRLRVWVAPTFGGNTDGTPAGGWCGTADVVAKARAAKAAGMEVLIDFHYSDFFADPSRQAIPTGWQGSTLDELARHVADHTTAVLTALKEAGVTPKWVQLGNETRSGMLYSRYEGKGAWSNITDTSRGIDGGATGCTETRYGGSWANYARLSNAGYDAAKAVFPDIICMSHVDTRASDQDLSWWFSAFSKAGGKCDMIALSHYPMPWNSGGETAATTSGKNMNAHLMTIIANTRKAAQLPVMIVETGTYCEYVNGGREVMQDLFDRCRTRNYIMGIFYWEPEQWGWWKPAIYNSIGWGNYNMGAFLSDGRPSPILDPWQPTDAERETEGIGRITAPATTSATAHAAYDLHGCYLTRQQHDVTIVEGRKVIK